MAFNFMKKFAGGNSGGGKSDKQKEDKAKKDKSKSKGINMGPSKKFMLNKKLMTQ